MQWQFGIIILGVFATVEPKNAWIYFRNEIGVVGWRRIQPMTSDGCTNVLQVAIAAQQSGKVTACLITNDGEIMGIEVQDGLPLRGQSRPVEPIAPGDKSKPVTPFDPSVSPTS